MIEAKLGDGEEIIVRITGEEMKTVYRFCEVLHVDMSQAIQEIFDAWVLPRATYTPNPSKGLKYLPSDFPPDFRR